MRILHTSDWHLGKRLFKLDRSEEHLLFLDWLLLTLVQKEIDVLLIAGDIFDTPTPPHQSLEIFYNFLHRVSVETKTYTYIIAGNHDSGLLLEAPGLLLESHRVKVWGKLSPEPKDHWIKLEHGSEVINLCAVPFFRSYELLPQGEGNALTALKKYFDVECSGPKFLMLHHLAGSFKAAGSEQVISLTGLESIPSEIFNAFDYVALGHIHKPQKACATGYYSGSPLPMRFSEIHSKSVMLIETGGGKPNLETLAIPVFRQLEVIKANETDWREKLNTLKVASQLTPVVEVQLKLNSPQAGLVDEIKNILDKKGMELLSFLPLFGDVDSSEKKHERIFELSTEELFKEFYAAKFPASPDLPAEIIEEFTLLLEKVKHETP